MRMKKPIFKMLRVSLAAAMLSGMLAACSGGGGPSGSSTDSSKKAPPATLKIELFDRGNTPPLTESYFVKYIQEKFGDPNSIKIEFVTVPRTEEVPKLNVLMSANEAPDLIFTYSDPAVQKGRNSRLIWLTD